MISGMAHSQHNIGLHFLVPMWNGRNITEGLALRRIQGVFWDELTRLAEWESLQAAEHSKSGYRQELKLELRTKEVILVNYLAKETKQSRRG